MQNSDLDTVKKYAKNKLDHLNALQYPIILEQKNKKFYLMIKELSLIAINEDLEAAYKELSAKKEKLFKDALEAEVEDSINLPQERQKRQEILYQLKIFFLKASIVCFLFGTLFTFALSEVKSKIFTKIFTLDTAKDISRSLVLEAEKFVSEPEDLQQERLERFHHILTGLSPFIHELKASSEESGPH